jgi:hypothetical protein
MPYLKKRIGNLLGLLIIVSTCFMIVNGQPSVLEGKIINILGQPIPRVTVVMESDTYLIRQLTDKEGRYSFQGPPGIYRISTESWVGKLSYNDEFYMPKDYSSYFRPALRANVKLSPEKSSTINFVLIESASILTHFDEKSDVLSGVIDQYDHLTPHPRIKYETIFWGFADGPFDLVVQYGSRRSKNGKIHYLTVLNHKQTSVFGKSFPGVVITYDGTTIYADRAEFNGKDVLRAEGNIMVEDGGEQFRSNKVEIILRSAKPVFNYER